MSNHTEDGSFAVFGDKLMTKTKKKQISVFLQLILEKKNKKLDEKRNNNKILYG